MKWLNRNPMTAVWFFGVCVCLAISSPNIKANMTTVSQVQKITQENSAKELQMRASQQALEAQSEIAESRYKSGCIMVVASNSPDNLTALEEGRPVMDAARKRPLSAGAVVCDGFGNTGVIVKTDGKPVVGEMAFTGDLNLVEAAKKRTRKRYLLPRT